MSVTSESVVSNSDATLEAFCRAVRTTLAGSITPAWTKSHKASLSASYPSVLPLRPRTRLTTTAPSAPAFSAISRSGMSSTLATMRAPRDSSPSSLSFLMAFSERISATPPPGTIPSSSAACVAALASSSRAFRSFISVSVAAPQLICATPPANLANRSCNFSRSYSLSVTSISFRIWSARPLISSFLPAPPTTIVSSEVILIFLARPRSEILMLSSSIPRSLKTAVAVVRTAMSPSIALRRSP